MYRLIFFVCFSDRKKKFDRMNRICNRRINENRGSNRNRAGVKELSFK
jgi:hypothetical protein